MLDSSHEFILLIRAGESSIFLILESFHETILSPFLNNICDRGFVLKNIVISKHLILLLYL